MWPHSSLHATFYLTVWATKALHTSRGSQARRGTTGVYAESGGRSGMGFWLGADGFTHFCIPKCHNGAQKTTEGQPVTFQVIWVEQVQFSSVAQSCPTLCDPMNHSTPGLPVHHQLPELTQTHVHQVSDAIQLSHALSSSSPAFSLSQHQGLFQ